MCEFRFEENNLGNIFNEINKDQDIAHFIVETAYMTFSSGRAGALTEPFPSFLLKSNEMRTKAGDLDSIKNAKAAGATVESATKINQGNKDINKGIEYLKIIYSVIQEIDQIHSEIAFRDKIM